MNSSLKIGLKASTTKFVTLKRSGICLEMPRLRPLLRLVRDHSSVCETVKRKRAPWLTNEIVALAEDKVVKFRKFRKFWITNLPTRSVSTPLKLPEDLFGRGEAIS